MEDNMDKEEILALSRKEKNDEGFLYMQGNGSKYGTILFCILIIILLLIAISTWNTTDMALILTILWGYLTGFFLGYSKASKEKRTGLLLFSSIMTMYLFATYIYAIFF